MVVVLKEVVTKELLDEATVGILGRVLVSELPWDALVQF